MEIFKNIATVVGCVSALIALTMTIIKPFRKWVIDSFVRQSQAKDVKAKIDNMVSMMNRSLENDDAFEKRLSSLANGGRAFYKKYQGDTNGSYC